MPDRLLYSPSASFSRTPEPLLWFVGAGHEVRTGPHYYYDCSARRDFPHVVLQLTLAGHGFHQPRNGPRRELPAGWAFFDGIPGDFEYGWAGQRPGDSYELAFVSMQGEPAYECMRRVHTVYGPAFDLGVGAQALGETLLGLLDAARAGTLRDRYAVSGLLYGLMMQLLGTLSRSRLAASPLVERAIDLVSAHAADPSFNITRLARSLDCSREHLAREFRRATGLSPLDHLAQHRVRLAAAELRSGPAKLSLVARRSGFASAAYFCRAFKRSVGLSPGQFRDRPWLVVP